MLQIGASRRRGRLGAMLSDGSLRPSSKRLARALLLAAGLTFTAPGAAQPSDSQGAVVLAHEARQKYDRGDWAAARDLFASADTKAHSPVLRLYMARCDRNLGRLLAARAIYRSVIAEELPPSASPPFVAAQREAEGDLRELEPRIPTLDLSRVSGDAEVWLDGAVLDTSALAGPVPVDPGAHVVTLRRSGVVLATKDVEVKAGQVAAVELSLSAPTTAEPKLEAPPAKPAPATTSAAPTADRAAPVVASGSLLPGVLTLIGGGLIVGGGIGTRVAAFDLVDGVRSRCEGTRCDASDEANVTLAEDLQTASTVLLVVGGAALAGGVVLTIVRPGGDDAPVAHVGLTLKPGWLAVEGRFR